MGDSRNIYEANNSRTMSSFLFGSVNKSEPWNDERLKARAAICDIYQKLVAERTRSAEGIGSFRMKEVTLHGRPALWTAAP